MESTEAYNKTERVLWVREWMGQAVLCVSQYYWTAEIHKAIKGGSQVQFDAGLILNADVIYLKYSEWMSNRLHK